ncbi:HNH endonuclease [Oxalobacteraceae bacterium A2-2]
MTKLTALKPRLQVASTSRIQPLAATVQRKRGSAGVRDRQSIRERDEGMCQECKRQGRTRLGSAVDHIVPLWQGGSDEDDNKELLCTPCHDAKTAQEAAQRGGRAF